MKYLTYAIESHGYINRFTTTGIFSIVQQFDKVTLSGEVNEWLKYGFSIHENPCRKEFLNKREEDSPHYMDLSKHKVGEAVRLFEQTNHLQVYFPFGNLRVENSGFYYVPTWLRSYYHTILNARLEKAVQLDLSTCGAAKIWLNGEEIIDFQPFTRNMVKSTCVTLNLKKGYNNLLICLDDLAERDTDYYFKLHLKDKSDYKNIKVLLPISGEVETEDVYAKEKMLEQMYFTKDNYTSEILPLQIRNITKKRQDISITMIPGEFVETMMGKADLLYKKDFVMDIEQNTISMLHTDILRPGYYYFEVRLQSCDVVLKRKIGTQLVREALLKVRAETIHERKQQARQLVLDGGINNIYKAAVMFFENTNLEQAESYILNEMPGVFQKQDCSDFHFVIALYMYQQYQDKMTQEVKTTLEEAMLTYRYWIDEPGDDVMWFFSENHALLFHICGYLAGSLLPNKTFQNSQLTGLQLKEKSEQLLRKWFKHFFQEFITEWNSAAYIPVDVLGIGTLYNATKAGCEFHDYSKQALDMIYRCLAINAHKGSLMTSSGRAYEKELKAPYNVGTTSLLYLGYNVGYLNYATIGYLPVILGNYEPPKTYQKYLELDPKDALIFENTQGFEQHANLYLYRNARVCLSTAIGFNPNKAGYQEHVVQASVDQEVHVYVNHPGEAHPYGSGRPNYWAGNGVLPMAMQHKNIAILRYSIPKEHDVNFTHAYIPLAECDEYLGNSYIFAIAKDGGYIGIRTLNKLTSQNEGPCRHREFISRGLENVWVISVGTVEAYHSLESFYDQLNQMDISLENQIVCVSDNKGNRYKIDESNFCFYNDKRLYNYPLDAKGVTHV